MKTQKKTQKILYGRHNKIIEIPEYPIIDTNDIPRIRRTRKHK